MSKQEYQYTGFPTEPPTPTYTTKYVWLIVLLVLAAALLVAAAIIYYLHVCIQGREKKKAREKKIFISEEHPLSEMSISLDAPAAMDKRLEAFLEMEGETTYRSPRRRKKKDVMNPLGESSMNLDFKGKTWGSQTPRGMDPFSEMDNGPTLPISPLGSKMPKSARSARSQKERSFYYGEITPYGGRKTPIHPSRHNGMMNGDVKRPLAITGGNFMSPENTMEVRTLKSEKSFHSVRSVKAPSMRAPSEKAMSVRAPSVRAPSVKAPSIRDLPAYKAPRVKSTKQGQNGTARSVKGPSVRSSKVGAVPRMQRSATSTKIGGFTSRRSAAPVSPRKKIVRSKTMSVTQDFDAPEQPTGMANFLEGETNWGSTSDAGRSVRSNRSTRTAKSRATTMGTPRKSIQSKMTGIPNYFKAISVS
ncbi:uncharacterized protein LOC128222825 isoform X2 [Mya arenaria]|uniref:uncharacterized protein LOC128222825 isoform X2 n=1 Tax=Mya arenaria TaxID=6604 RepID=UPI0022DEF55D|nr:uncharacterized protein LOC128222825 isoform X2 [Mya arenaria]